MRAKKAGKQVLLMYTDGGPDHNTFFVSNQLSPIGLYLLLDLDVLIAIKTAPQPLVAEYGGKSDVHCQHQPSSKRIICFWWACVFFYPRNVCKKHPSRLAQREAVKAVRKQVLIFCDILVTYTVFQVCEELGIHVNKLSKIMTKFCFSEIVLTYSLLSRNSNHLIMKSQLIGSAMLQLV